MTRLRNREIPACGAIIALLALSLTLTTPCWSAEGLADLAGPLRDLAMQAGGAGAARQLGPLAAPGAGGEVLVVVQFRSEMAAAAQSLAAFGARVRFRHGSRVEAFVPVDQLLAIASLPDVAQVRPPNYPIPAQGFGGTSSEGVQLVGAVPFHAAGIMGQNVSVAIIDVGFADIDNAEVTLGPNAQVSFRADGTMGSSYHGTAVAEVVADMAPLATITAIAVDTEMAVESAIDYVINRDVDVCCMSMGLLGGPYDGSHPVSQAVNRARSRGVFWVNAAGNTAQQHYMGDWSDRDRDDIGEFAAGDEDLDLMLPAGQYVAYLSWYETAGSRTNRDYDLVLYDAANTEVARSGYSQNGDDPPADTLIAYIDTAAQYTLRIEHVGGPTEPADRFQLFSVDVDLEPSLQVPASSLTIPAEATGAFTVGAVRGALITDPAVPALPIDGLEPFSSQGPVVGHPTQTKPDLVAPDGVATSLAAEGFSPFLGTSAAAPHVAGAAALLLDEDGNRTADEVGAILRSQALRLGDPVPNNEFGWGRLRMRVGADSRPPTVTISYPQNGTSITTRTPTIIAYIQDDGSGVDPTTITVEFNGVVMFDGSTVADITEFYDDRTGQFTWSVGEVVARTNHTAVINVSDYVGNAATPAVTNFRVVAPTIPGGVSIVSFPYTDLAVTDPSMILGTPLSDLALVRWWPLDEAYDKYHFYPDARASLVPPDCQQADLDERTVPYPPAGLGYFLSIPREAVLDIQGRPLRDVPSTHIRLFRGQQPPRGWNLVGNPFDEAVSWGSVQFVTNGVRQDLREAIASGVTEGVLFEYVQGVGGGASYYDFNPNPNAAIMAPRKGYWLHVNEDTRVVIYSSNIGALSDAPQAAEAAGADEGWTLTLSARAGACQDPRNILGVKPAASAGYDPGWDVPKPPAISDGLRVSMARPGWGEHAGDYACDIRGPADEQVWDIDVSCALPNTDVEVSWPDLNSVVPGDVRLVLEDLDSGASVYMRTSASYRFRTGPDGGTRHLRVSVVGGSEALALRSMATEPVGGGAMITYAVTMPADVTVDIMNIAGRLIKSFPARAVAGGAQQTLSWNGIGERGSAVPAGRYIVRLTARAADGQTVQAIRPLSIAR